MERAEMHILVTTMWRGVLHVIPGRIFHNPDDALAYAKRLKKEGEGILVFVRYFDDQPPQLIQGIDDFRQTMK